MKGEIEMYIMLHKFTRLCKAAIIKKSGNPEITNIIFPAFYYVKNELPTNVTIHKFTSLGKAATI